MSTMMTFEYLIQLCLSKDQVHPLIGGKDATGQQRAKAYGEEESVFIPILNRMNSSVLLLLLFWVHVRVCVCVCVCIGEALAATPAEGIHTVPFQFDLMKLLPKCQQIELFFFTFSKGILIPHTSFTPSHTPHQTHFTTKQYKKMELILCIIRTDTRDGV